MGNFRYPSLWEKILLPILHARAKVTRMKVGFDMHVVSTICTDFNEALCETLVKSSSHLTCIARCLSKDQAGTWKLISVNINHQCSVDISVIVEKLLTPVCTRTHLPVISPYLNWNCRVMSVMEANLGSSLCWFRIGFSKLRDRGGSKRDVQPFSLEPFFGGRQCSRLRERLGCR